MCKYSQVELRSANQIRSEAVIQLQNKIEKILIEESASLENRGSSLFRDFYQKRLVGIL